MKQFVVVTQARVFWVHQYLLVWHTLFHHRVGVLCVNVVVYAHTHPQLVTKKWCNKNTRVVWNCSVYLFICLFDCCCLFVYFCLCSGTKVYADTQEIDYIGKCRLAFVRNFNGIHTAIVSEQNAFTYTQFNTHTHTHILSRAHTHTCYELIRRHR